MQLSWALRIALYIQLLLGMDRFSGGAGGTLTRELHLTLGIVVAALALIVFRPLPELAGKLPIRTAARFAPLAPLAIGLGFRFLGWYALPGLTPVLVAVHVALAFVAVALVEIATARTRRLLAPEELVVKREGT